MSTNEPVAPQAPAIEPVVSTPAPETPPASQPITADPKDRREVIRQAMNGKTPASRLRDETGKFTATTPKPTEATPSVPVPPSRPAMPNTWNKELAPHWEQAPIEILNRAIAREEEMKRGIEPLKTAKQQYDELMSQIAPYDPIIRSAGLTPIQAITSLLQTQKFLQTGSQAEKVAAFAQMLQQHGITPDQLTANPTTLSTAPTAPDPIVMRLAQQVDALTAAQQTEKENRVNSAIEQFASSADHPHYAAVAETMEGFLLAPHLLGKDFNQLSEVQKLQRAYDKAILYHPEIHALVTAQGAAPPQATPQAPAATPRKTNLQVKGAPAQGAPPKVDPKDRRAVIRAALSRSA